MADCIARVKGASFGGSKTFKKGLFPFTALLI